MSAVDARRSAVPRETVTALLVIQMLVVLPHFERLPVGVIAIGVIAWAWRWALLAERVAYPGLLLRSTLALAGLAAAIAQAPGPFSLELAVQLLMVAFLLKALEIRTRRDAFVVVLIAWFAVGVEFLFRQDMLIGLWGLACVIATAAVLPGMAVERGARLGSDLRRSATLVLQALPLAVALFLFFPRIAPLWSMPAPDQAQSGITDRMAPGSIARLTQTDAVAFRVDFAEPGRSQLPVQERLYWRGLIYYAYDAGVWSPGQIRGDASQLIDWFGGADRPWRVSLEAGPNPAIDYQVTLEATRQNWLFALDLPVGPGAGTGITRDWRLLARTPVSSRTAYRVATDLDATLDRSALAPWMRFLSLAQGDSDPRAQALARQLTRDDPAATVRAVIGWYASQPFVYTLTPPLLEGADQIDAFLFDTRQGFCTHFAGSFVMLMRAAGIPARLVGGYQGGEWNDIGGFLTVRQRDAHAWAEVWIEGAGWQRVDPTAVIAPARIELGLEAALAGVADQQLLGANGVFNAGDWSWLQAARHWFESVEFRWNSWVMGYDGNLQLLLMREWFGDVDRRTLTGLLAVVAAVGMVAMALLVLGVRRRPRRSSAQRVWMALRRALAPHGVLITAQDTPGAVRTRLEGLDPRLVEPALRLTDLLEMTLYRNSDADLDTLWRRCRSDLVHLRVASLWVARSQRPPPQTESGSPEKMSP